jgi:uncharacterized membrane protein YdjX (TVP38/TMEM64 family)
MQNNTEKKKGLTKLFIFMALVVILLLLNNYFGWSAYWGNINHLGFLKEIVSDNFLLAVLIYIVLTIIGCVILALPGITFAFIAGVLFGPIAGILVCLFATTLGAMFAFLISRFFLKDAVKPMIEKNRILKKLLFSKADQNDVIILMVTRMLPIFPYNLQNLAYGITDISFRKYSMYTFLFMFPGVSFFTIGAAGLVAEKERWRYFLIAGALAVIVTGIGLWIHSRFLKDVKKEIKDTSANEEEE